MNRMQIPFQKVAQMFTRNGAHVHPVRDWFIILGAAAVLMGGCVGWSAVTYLSALSMAEEVAPDATRPVFDTKAVDAVRAAFEARAAEAVRYKNEYRFVDPSR